MVVGAWVELLWPEDGSAVEVGFGLGLGQVGLDNAPNAGGDTGESPFLGHAAQDKLGMDGPLVLDDALYLLLDKELGLRFVELFAVTLFDELQGWVVLLTGNGWLQRVGFGAGQRA